MLIDCIFDVNNPRVSLEASTELCLFIVLRIVFIQTFYCLSCMTGSLSFYAKWLCLLFLVITHLGF